MNMTFSLVQCRGAGAPNRKAIYPQHNTLRIAPRTQLNAAHTDTPVEAKRNK